MEIINEKHKITMPIRDYERIINDKKEADRQLKEAYSKFFKQDTVTFFDYSKNSRVELYLPNETNAALVENMNKTREELDKAIARKHELSDKLYQYSRHWFLRYFVKF